MPISIYAQDKIMDGLLAKPFISLHSQSPKSTGECELFGGNYKRISAADLLPPSKSGSKVSVGDLTFKDLPECRITHIGIWDAETAGNLLWSLELMEEQTIFRGNTFTIPAGKLELGLS
jgi:hypothetical protein